MAAYIQTPPDSTGKKIELERLQNADGSDTYRQRMADGAKVQIEGELGELILLELRVMNFLMARVQASLMADAHPIDLMDLRQELKTIDLRNGP